MTYIGYHKHSRLFKSTVIMLFSLVVASNIYHSNATVIESDGQERTKRSLRTVGSTEKYAIELNKLKPSLRSPRKLDGEDHATDDIFDQNDSDVDNDSNTNSISSKRSYYSSDLLYYISDYLYYYPDELHHLAILGISTVFVALGLSLIDLEKVICEIDFLRRIFADDCESTQAPTPSSTRTTSPSVFLSSEPSPSPSAASTRSSSSHPTVSTFPSEESSRSLIPTVGPSSLPSTFPSSIPSQFPSKFPTVPPTLSPSEMPSESPSSLPSLSPSEMPSESPSSLPSLSPSLSPSASPSFERLIS